ncbi:hypothetical protein GCM10009102_23420 [Sphingomonas insulae]|uniref:Uncharacterized protein n=2 Tax=Sphingomonas insulae TaxID=424800 RepID=A0ABN1HX69_9SPHN
MSSEITMTTNNPFAVLGVSTRDDRVRIMEAAEERADILDPEICSQARATLTNPRKRLEAELGWFPGTSPKIAEQALSTPVAGIDQLPLAGLAKANGLAIAAERWTPSNTEQLGSFLDRLSAAVDEVDLTQVLREVNEDREIAGFPAFSSAEAAEDVLRDRRQAWRRSAMMVMERTPTADMAEAMFILVDRLEAEKRFPLFMHELIADYALRAQPFMAREVEGAERLVDKARELAGLRPDALPPLFDALKELLGTWDEVTRPIQLSATLLGRKDSDSENLAFAVRGLSIDLYNDHRLVDEARQVSAMVGASFSALPRIATQVAEDAKALEKLAAEAAQEEADLAYAVDIGTFSKSRLAIDKAGIEWKGQRTSLSAVCGVRWGAVKKSVNGIPTGTDYLIAWTDGLSTTTAEFKNGAIFEAFVPKLWKAVGFRLVDEMVSTLGGGGELRFGNMIVRDNTVVLTKRKFMGSEPAEFGWGDVSVTTADGSFVVNGPKGSKASASMPYREVTNIHFFELLVRQAFKNGRVRLSEAFA